MGLTGFAWWTLAVVGYAALLLLFWCLVAINDDEDDADGVDASDEVLALEALPVAHLRSLTHPDWLEVCGKDEDGAFPVFASHEALRRSIAAAAGVPAAFAFCDDCTTRPVCQRQGKCIDGVRVGEGGK